MLATSLVSGALWWHFSGGGRGTAHLCPEGSSLLGETGRREVADHIGHGPVHRAAAGRLTLDAPGDRGGAVTGQRTKKNSVPFPP